jgi:hypothetical protein
MDNMWDRPVVVLNDGETYTGADGCNVLFLSKKGEEQLDENGEVKDIEYLDILYQVSLDDLIQLWIDRNG